MKKLETADIIFFTLLIISFIAWLIILVRYIIPHKVDKPVNPTIMIKHEVDKNGIEYSDTTYIYKF